jgi:hypothetical protein
MKSYLGLFATLLFLSSSWGFSIELNEREILAKKIKHLASNFSCDNDSECKTIGFGSRSCGGFETYLIYSTKSVNFDYMESLSRQYYKLDKQYQVENGGISICVSEQPRVSACIYKRCVDLGDKPNSLSKLHWAVENRDVGLIRTLVQQGVKIDIKAGALDLTPLQFAIWRKLPLDIIKLLVELGANINASNSSVDETRTTPLHLAASRKRIDIVKYLLVLGANKNAGGKYSPFYDAEIYLKDLPKYDEIREMLRPDNYNEDNKECLKGRSEMTSRAWVYNCLKVGPKPKWVDLRGAN